MESSHISRPQKTTKDPRQYDWDAEVRGNFIAFRARRKFPTYFVPKKRKPISSFSRRSRHRLFKKICQIEWAKTRKGLFITLTFPDEVMPLNARRRQRMLSELFRRIENHLGRKIAALWRCEWIDRKSGIYKGNFLPHFHLLIFDVEFLAWQKVRRWWREITGFDCPKELRTEVKRMGTSKAQRIYIAKYCAKLPDSLVNVPYCRIDGRHWGYHRHALLPLGQRWYFSDISLANVAVLRRIAASCIPEYDEEKDLGACIMFQFGELLKGAVLQFLLDSETPDG